MSRRSLIVALAYAGPSAGRILITSAPFTITLRMWNESVDLAPRMQARLRHLSLEILVRLQSAASNTGTFYGDVLRVATRGRSIIMPHEGVDPRSAQAQVGRGREAAYFKTLTRQMILPTSSATSSPPDLSIATPTGRP